MKTQHLGKTDYWIGEKVSEGDEKTVQVDIQNSDNCIWINICGYVCDTDEGDQELLTGFEIEGRKSFCEISEIENYLKKIFPNYYENVRSILFTKAEKLGWY